MGLVQRDMENSYLNLPVDVEDSLLQLQGASVSALVKFNWTSFHLYKTPYSVTKSKTVQECHDQSDLNEPKQLINNLDITVVEN